jgi:hypothetical protein
MGAWGYGNFENDTALDWIWELEKTSDLGLVERAISDVVNCDDYLDADLGCVGLAAAEVVAALMGKPPKDLPEEASAWIQAHQLVPAQELVQASLAAIDKVRNQEQSELKELWEEEEEEEEEEEAELLTEWHAVLYDLSLRLK